ncbi:hypothetical protein RVY78_06655 [Veillonella sp. YH-vei2232]|uniref:hypothetical protein n=1 Tax=Veillonella TaxID=29465 RepID=UPI0025D6A726|nr:MULTISPECIES: hypothetical protein [unclassified Veillonella]MBK7921276.1 hypothetical protein [Veillonella sp.]MDV5063642.1 hypothetical protein [Veillonella sp. YH-vei2232]
MGSIELLFENKFIDDIEDDFGFHNSPDDEDVYINDDSSELNEALSLDENI